jgi:hypothetical protein
MAERMEFESRAAQESAYARVMDEVRRAMPNARAERLNAAFLGRLEGLLRDRAAFETFLDNARRAAALEPYEARVRAEHPTMAPHRVLSTARARMRQDAADAAAARAKRGAR